MFSFDRPTFFVKILAGLLIYCGMIIWIEQDTFPRHLLPMRQNLGLETRYQLMLPVL